MQGQAVILGLVFWAVSGLASAGSGVTGEATAPAAATFASEIDAVVAASAAVNARSIREDREFLGAVLRRGSDYHYSLVPGHAGADRIRARLVVPEGFELVAFWHTHGAAGPERRYFSVVDANLVARRGKPLYLADYTGALRVLKPGAPRLSALAARQRGLPARAGYAVGETLSQRDGAPVRIPTRAEPALAMAVNN